MDGILKFSSVHWQYVPGRGERALILCDRDRPKGLAFLVGTTVDIDGSLYDVVGAEHRRIAGPLAQGEQVLLWVRPHFDAQPTAHRPGRA